MTAQGSGFNSVVEWLEACSQKVEYSIQAEHPRFGGAL
jgi:hypothetical protein